MKNRLMVGTIVGQAVVTLVAIGYGASAHSSWEGERQRRVDGERAAVTEMAVAMKSARERLDKVEQDLKRCRGRSRRTARVTPAPVAGAAGAPAPPALGAEGASRPLTAEPSPEPAAMVAAVTPAPPPAPAWCGGRYDEARGTSFAPCPAPRSPTAQGRSRAAEAHGRP